MKALLLPLYIASALIPFTSQAHAAESLPFNAGKWEITSKASMPMMPQPIVSKDIECIREKTISAEHFAKQSGGTCKADSVRVSGKNIKWDMSCSVEGNLMVGHGSMKVNNASMKGNMTMTMSMQGMKMEMKTSWSGKRLGECN
ncbi:DUF3617 family protein [Neptunomonas sp.]|uniref:DUF3617 domain-containing protein n=1 Tax=Neptunomonas sp. TaxID=1971898 RepID=UPI0025E729CB|nr:DUF3617 family protein [Neptunomonas sp.]